MGEPDDEDRQARTPLEVYEELRNVASSAYPTIVSGVVIERIPGDAPRNLRVFFVEGGFLDVWLSDDRYSFHYQSDDDVVRFDNAPHHDHVDTYPITGTKVVRCTKARLAASLSRTSGS